MSKTSSARRVPVSQSLTPVDDLPRIIRRFAAADPARVSLTFLAGDVDHGTPVTYGELDLRARAVAAALQEKAGGDCTGKRALLVFQPGLDFIVTYLGCLYAGVVAVPTYAPHPAQLKKSVDRFLGIVKDAKPEFFLTTGAYVLPLRAMMAAFPNLWRSYCIDTGTIDVDTLAGRWREPEIGDETIAFLQYTSGSTSSPKGVMVSHGNLVHNLRAIERLATEGGDPRGVSWLPPYHDMGLIGGILQPIFAGFPGAILSPLEFLQRPAFWLEAITRFKATVSPLPNFALEYCLRRVSDDVLKTLDLSSWTVAINGAEPVRKESLERFTARFGRCGFRHDAHKAVYGLAEGTLMTSCEYRRREPRGLKVSVAGIEAGRIAAPREGEASRWLVSCGSTIEGQEIAIVDPVTRLRSEAGVIGEIWLKGPSVARGYWKQPENNELTFAATIEGTGEGPYLRTGDLGFLEQDELFVTGRRKDLIIHGGKNYYPQDIEYAVESSHGAVRPGATVAIGLEDEHTGERIVVVAEVDRRRLEREARKELAAGLPATAPGQFDPEDVVRKIRQAVREKVGIDVADVVLIVPNSLAKTSSGKVRRAESKRAYLEGKLVRI